MAETYKATLRKTNADGTSDVYIVLTKDRKPSYLSLGFSVLPKHWNPDADLQKPLWVRSGNVAAVTYNAAIQRKLKLAADWISKRPTLTSGQWRDAVKAGLDASDPATEAEQQAASSDFLEFFAQEVDRRRASGKIRTAERLRNILNKLREYQGWVPATGGSPEVPAQPLLYKDFTASYIARYRDWVVGVKGNKGQTPDKELSFIKTVLRLAIDEGLMPAQKNPFAKIKFKNPVAKKVKLTDEEVEALETVALPATPGLQFARDTWMLQYFLYGARIADVLLLRWRDVSEQDVTFREQKTNKLKIIERHPRIDFVLERLRRAAESKTNRPVQPEDFLVPLIDAKAWYADYPPLFTIEDLGNSKPYRAHYEALLARLESLTAKTNYYLKMAAKHAGITKHLTSHVARHSFAAMARRKGTSSFDLRDMLNHHSVALTERYAGELEKDELAHRAHSLYQRPPGITPGITSDNNT